MAKQPRQSQNLSQTINTIKKDINAGFSELLARVEALEASDARNSMDIRDLQIQMRARRGDKQRDIARDFGLGESRVSQIVNAGRTRQ